MQLSPRRRKQWDVLSPPQIAVTEDEAADSSSRGLSDSRRLSVPPLGLGRMRSSDGPLLGALSAREGSSSLAESSSLPPQPFTARPLGVTPRNAAMLGPRSDVLVRDVDLGLPPPSNAAAAHAAGGPRTPRGGRSPQGSDAAARRGESHPRVLSNDWALAAGAEVGALPSAAAAAWLPHALGGRVEIVAEGVRGMLLGPAAGEGQWTVAPEHGAPPRAVPAEALRRVPPAKGELARTVLGSATGFYGEVLSIERSVAVVRGSSGATAAPRVRVLPLDTLCALP